MRLLSLDLEEIAPNPYAACTFDNVPIRKLLIANIPPDTTHKELKKEFLHYGEVVDCILIKRKKYKKSYAFVTYKSVQDAVNARQAGLRKNIKIGNQNLRVLPANSWNQPDNISRRREIEESQKNLCNNDELDKMFDSKCTIDDEDAAIHKLNDYCLFHIFKYLSVYDRIKIERVCKRWRAVSMELWQSFKILDYSHLQDCKLKSPFLYHILRRSGKYITNIDFSAIDHSNFGTISMVAKLCPNVESVNYGDINVDVQTLKALAQNCTNIKILRMQRVSTRLVRNILSSLFTKNKSLQCLDMTIKYDGYKYSLINCLYSLPYHSMKEITLRCLLHHDFPHISKIIQKFQSLCVLELSFRYSYISRLQCIETTFLSSIEKQAKSLTVLEISHLSSGINVIPMAKLKNLKELNVSKSKFVDNEFLKALSSSCKLLTNLNISDCNDVTNLGLSNVVSLPKLLHLDVSNLDKITDKVLGDMNTLKTLICKRCANVGNAGLINLIAIDNDLELLDIIGCRLVSDELVEAAAELTKYRINGKILVIKVCTNIQRALDFATASPFLNIDYSPFW